MCNLFYASRNGAKRCGGEKDVLHIKERNRLRRNLLFAESIYEACFLGKKFVSDEIKSHIFSFMFETHLYIRYLNADFVMFPKMLFDEKRETFLIFFDRDHKDGRVYVHPITTDYMRRNIPIYSSGIFVGDYGHLLEKAYSGYKRANRIGMRQAKTDARIVMKEYYGRMFCNIFYQFDLGHFRAQMFLHGKLAGLGITKSIKKGIVYAYVRLLSAVFKIGFTLRYGCENSEFDCFKMRNISLVDEKKLSEMMSARDLEPYFNPDIPHEIWVIYEKFRVIDPN